LIRVVRFITFLKVVSAQVSPMALLKSPHGALPTPGPDLAVANPLAGTPDALVVAIESVEAKKPTVMMSFGKGDIIQVACELVNPCVHVFINGPRWLKPKANCTQEFSGPHRLMRLRRKSSFINQLRSNLLSSK
jgi:hypothetical protein